MKILLDQCVPRRYLRLLQTWGYNASLLNTHIPPNSSDTAVITLAKQLDAVFLTTDLDFANIQEYPPVDYAGIVVLRYHLSHQSDIDMTLQTALNELTRDALRGALVIISPGRYRIRR